MSRVTPTEGRLAAVSPGGRPRTAAAVPFLVLDLGRGRDPHQARCRRCRWCSGWRMTAAWAKAEHDRHQAAAHGPRRRSARRGGFRLVARWRHR
jgi:hypothetical protein